MHLCLLDGCLSLAGGTAQLSGVSPCPRWGPLPSAQSALGFGKRLPGARASRWGLCLVSEAALGAELVPGPWFKPRLAAGSKRVGRGPWVPEALQVLG